MIRRIACILFSSVLLAAPAITLAAPPDSLINSLVDMDYPDDNNTYQSQADQYISTPSVDSGSALVINSSTGVPLYQKNIQRQAPIASITKLMTAMVILDSDLSMNEPITITSEDIDRLKGSSSRLQVGTTLSRREMLLLALMSSENRAAHALARTYPGGEEAFIARMNRKARGLGMRNSAFYDPTGLTPRNVSTAADLALMVKAAYDYPLIRQDSTWRTHQIVAADGRTLTYNNSNMLVREGIWDISLQKTGYIREAGRCMVMHAKVGDQPVIMVFLDARNSLNRANDARALKYWLENQPAYLLQQS